MDTTIPYHTGMLLGRSVNLKTIQPGDMLIGEDTPRTERKVSQTVSRFSFATSLKDVCDILSIPPEYALKVKAGIKNVHNELVGECMENLGKEDKLKIIFRVTYIEQKKNISPADVPVSVAEKDQGHPGTHWVKALEIGNELVTVLTVSSKDSEKLKWLRKKLLKCLQAYSGQLDGTMIEALKNCGCKIDKKLSKPYYADICLDIQYASFTELDNYPASMQGMVKIIDHFTDQCVGWTERSKQGKKFKVEARVIRCKPRKDKKEKTTVKDSVKHIFSKSPASGIVAYLKNEACEKGAYLHSDDDLDDFVPYFFNMRITLQSLKKNLDSCGSLAMSQSTETTYTVFERLFKQLVTCLEAHPTITNFISNKHCFLDGHIEEGNRVIKSIYTSHRLVMETVAGLDFVCIPTENTLENVITKNPLNTVNDFIENVTSKLPPGSDISLLMFGKTGHGKSATGNSILGQDTFRSSSDTSSVTSQSGVGWAEIDGRIIKVVDTPGVFDTKFDDEASVDLAIKSISKAIACCPEGFHALLLFFRFGTRMTSEERNAIMLLKKILGEDIINSHFIFVMTYGDNFETEMKGTKTTFEDWCKRQDGDFKKLFEECHYRCVLFNNKATDPKVKKAQLIKLVVQVDSLTDSGTRYRNSLFELAERERERIIAEEKVPSDNEEILIQMQLILQSLDSIINSESEEYSHELSRLKMRFDNLQSKITAKKDPQFDSIFAVICALSEIISVNIDESVSAQTDAVLERWENFVQNQDLMAEIDKFKEQHDERKAEQNETTDKVALKLENEIKTKSCFPGSSVVMLSNGKYVTLEELCVGDKVLVRDKIGCQSFDTVYMFGHQELEASSEFLALKTASQTVYVTSGHYVYCMKNGTELCVSAENLHVGDCVLVATEDGFVPQPVQAVTCERKRGLFAPFTNSGNILIDGALMSCYIDVLPATTCHTLLWPVRQLYRVSPRLLSYINGPSPKHPIPRWAKAAMKLM